MAGASNEVKAQRVVNPVPPQSRMSFRYTINAYRGCSHRCVYCFARPTHEYLNLNIGEDFDRKIVVKVNAVERVRAEVAAKRWAGDLIAMGTNTVNLPYHCTHDASARLHPVLRQPDPAVRLPPTVPHPRRI